MPPADRGSEGTRKHDLTMKSNIDLDRRKVLGTVGGLALAGSGMAAFTGSAAADGDATLSDASTLKGSNDDGEVQYVAFGGKLTYAWDGLDTEAEYGGYRLRTRVYSKEAFGGWSGWQNFGWTNGELGGNWGGDNDHTAETGTKGYFTFKYGKPFNQASYAIAYDDEVANNPGDYTNYGLRLVPESKAYSTDVFSEDDDDSTQRTVVEFEYTCRVYDGDPSDGGTVIQRGKTEDTATGRMEVKMTNEPATGDTGGSLSGTMGADE